MAQEVLVQGNITSLETDFSPASTTAAFYKYKDTLGREYISSMPVNHLGQFRHTFPAQTKIQLYIYYNEYVPIDTVLNTGDGPVVSLRFMLVSKMLGFSAAKAQEDIENQKVRIIFHDAHMARLFRKAGFQDKYGFHFSYVPRPDSWEALRDISEYNAVMETYLDNLNPRGWRDRLYAEMDSLIEIRESFAGLDDDAEAEQDEEVFIPVPEQPVASKPVESDVADVHAIPEEVSVASANLQENDSLSLPKPVYLPMESKEPLPVIAFDEATDDPEVRLAESSIDPAVTTSPKPEIFIPAPEIEAEAPIASAEVIEEETDLMTSKSPATQSGPSADLDPEPSEEEEVIAAAPEEIFEESEEESSLADLFEISEPKAQASASVSPEEETLEEELMEEPMTEIEFPEELEASSPAEEIVAATPAEELSNSTPMEEVEERSAEPTPIVISESPVVEEQTAASQNDQIETELEPITQRDLAAEEAAGLVPGIHTAPLPMTPPPAREDAPQRNTPVYTGGSITDYFDEAQSETFAKAVAQSEALYGTFHQNEMPRTWQFPRDALIPASMQTQLAESQEMFENYYLPRLKWQTEAPVAFMLRRIDQDPNYRSLDIIKYWSSIHYEALIPELIFRLTYTEVVGLKNYRDIIIWDRVDSGDMTLDGPGAEVKDDLFAVAGRANYLLKNLTGEDFGDIGMATSHEERLEIRDRWVSWLFSLSSGHSMLVAP